VGWHINRGPDKEADYVPAAQLKKHYYRPDVVANAIDLANAEEAAREVKIPFQNAELTRRSPPKFAITSPADKSSTDKSPVAVSLQVEANADPVKGLEVSVNGRQVSTRDDRGMARVDGKAFAKTFEAPLEKGENRIRITVSNDVGETVKELTVNHAGAAPATLDKRGALYVVAVGVDAYTKVTPLRFAGADAKAFRDAVVAKAGMLFLAGHGVNDGPDYLFLPQDASSDGEHWRTSSVIKWYNLQLALQSAQGRRILFVDTCHAGGAFNPRLIKDAADAQIIVFSATDDKTLAQERPELGHGVFTHALVAGLNGEADLLKHGAVNLFELNSYVANKVKTLTNNAQEPTIHLSGAKDFVIAAH
jgi:hypothetical protein